MFRVWGDLGFRAHGLHIWVVLLSGFGIADLGRVLLFGEVGTLWYFSALRTIIRIWLNNRLEV